MNRQQVAGFASVYFFCKGMAGTLMGLCLLPLLKETFEVSSVLFQKYSLVVMLPWSVKPIIAALADTYGIARWLVGGLALVGAVAAAMLTVSTSVQTAVALAVVCSAEIAFIDILAEGEYVYIMQTKQDSARRRIVSIVWTLLLVGQLASSVLVGFVDNRTLLVIIAVLLAMPMLPVLFQWLFTPRTTKFWAPGAKLGGMLTLAAIGLVPVTTASPNYIKLAYVTCVSTALLAATFWYLPGPLAKANAYMFATSVLYINVTGAVDYWFTASSHCVPGGPSFNLQYYISAGAIVSSLFATLGVGIFNQCFKNITRYRTMFLITASVRILAASTDIVLMNRWNLRVGIPDKIMFLFGDAALQSVAAALETMPLIMLTSELATGGAEATTYALLAGFQNFGGAVSMTYGYVLQETLQITFDNTHCNSQNITWLVGIAHMVMPLATIPLSFLLVD